MRKNEVRALAHASALLLTISGFRMVLGFADRPGPETLGPTVLDALIASSEDAATESAARDAPLQPGERIDPNSATEADLDRLPGIGPALAQRIVAARAEGPFRSAADLERVPGIGPKTLAPLSQKLTFSGTSTMRHPAIPRMPPRSTNQASVPRSLDFARMSPNELQALDGIGPALAERIVDFRVGRGGILTLDDLLQVPGIGPATLERVRRSLERMRRGG